MKKPGFVTFTGATYTNDEDEKIFNPIAPVAVNPALVEGYYEHTILLGGHKIHVMESMEMIGSMLGGGKRR